MKNCLLRDLLALGVTLIALMSFAVLQRADANPVFATPRQSQPAGSRQPAQPRGEPASSGEVQTQEALAFTGRVVKVRRQFVLQDPTTKVSYQLDDQSKARPYLGKQVKITGKLEMNSNTIHIDSIEPLS